MEEDGEDEAWRRETILVSETEWKAGETSKTAARVWYSCVLIGGGEPLPGITRSDHFRADLGGRSYYTVYLMYLHYMLRITY